MFNGHTSKIGLGIEFNQRILIQIPAFIDFGLFEDNVKRVGIFKILNSHFTAFRPNWPDDPIADMAEAAKSEPPTDLQNKFALILAPSGARSFGPRRKPWEQSPVGYPAPVRGGILAEHVSRIVSNSMLL